MREQPKLVARPVEALGHRANLGVKPLDLSEDQLRLMALLTNRWFSARSRRCEEHSDARRDGGDTQTRSVFSRLNPCSTSQQVRSSSSTAGE